MGQAECRRGICGFEKQAMEEIIGQGLAGQTGIDAVDAEPGSTLQADAQCGAALDGQFFRGIVLELPGEVL